jgi:hypothetical protein
MAKPFLIRLKRLRFALPAFVFLVVATVTIAQSPDADPIEKEMQAFESAVNTAFGVRTAPTEAEALMHFVVDTQDKMLKLGSPELDNLVGEFRKIKGVIENASKEREALEMKSPTLNSLSLIASRYLNGQRRLYVNYYRNVHQLAGKEPLAYPNQYEDLNLMLRHNLGVTIVQHPDLNLKFNVSHFKDLFSHYENVELFLTPQDKDLAEEIALKDVVNAQNYAKLVHFMTTRSRIINHWNLQRISVDASIPDPDLQACARNFGSFRHSTHGERGYFTSLKKEDLYQEFDRKVNGIAAVTQDFPLVPTAVLARALKKFFLSIPGFKESLAYEDIVYNKEEHLYWGEDHAANLLKGVENGWSKDTATRLTLANFMGDRWNDPNDAADRVSWLAFKSKKILLVDAIYLNLMMPDKAYLLSTVEEKNREAIVKGLIQKALDSELTLEVELEARKELNARIIGYLQSSESRAITKSMTAERMKELVRASTPALNYAGNAAVVKAQVQKYLNVNRDCKPPNTSDHGITYQNTSDPVKCRYFNEIVTGGAFTLALEPGDDEGGLFMPARGLLTARVSPWTPDQLSQYFFSKLEFF